MIDPYSVLGVNRNSSKDDIKKAYRKLAMKNHPDRGGDETKFKEIKEAYERITEPSKFQQPGGGGGPFGGNPGEFRWDNTPGGFSFRRGGSVEDIFEDFFGFHGSRGQRTKQVQMSIWIDLEDVYKGGDEEMDKKYNVGDILCVEDGGEGLNLDEYLDLPADFKAQVGVDVGKSSKEVKHDFSNLNEDFNLEAA